MKKLFTSFAIAAALTVIFGTIYAAVQQSLRQSANDPQIQLAEDAAAELNRGIPPLMVTTSTKIDLKDSLAPFIIIYDKNGRVVSGSGYLNGENPTIPFGVLQHATADSYNAVTWQLQKDVRLAAVAAKAHDYYVLSGRSLREVEKRENMAFQISAMGWLVTLLLLGACLGLRELIPKKRANKKHS
jgi:hypothetical protein